MKVLHVSGAKSWGGNEQQLIDIIPELNKLGVENFILGVEKQPLHKACESCGIKFIPCKKDKLNRFVNYKYLKQVVKQYKPDIIHLHTSDSLTVFTLADILYRLKLVAVFSKKGMGNSSSFLSKIKYNYRNISAVICVSRQVKQDFSEILNSKNKKKLAVIYDGIATSRIKTHTDSLKELFKIPRNKLLIGNIANHVRAKDLTILVKAMNELVNVLGLKNIHLIQIGAFHDEITLELRNLIREYNLENHITLAGFLKDASGFISQFEIFTMSSEREGFPLTVYESFYKKVPVVSTKAGGIPEIITDGENGFLADIKDYKNLALKMNALMSDNELQNKFMNQAYDIFVNNYTTTHCAEKTFKLYKKVSL